MVELLWELARFGLFRKDVKWNNVRWGTGGPCLVDFGWATVGRAGFPFYGSQGLPIVVATVPALVALCACAGPVSVGHSSPPLEHVVAFSLDASGQVDKIN